MSSDILDSTIHAYLPAAARGDQAAYGRIVAGCQGMVTSIALAIVRDVQASEDIAQEAFLSAWQNLRKLGNPASFLPWLRQITRNLARDHLRSQRYRANPPGDIDALIAAVADPHPGPEHSLAELQESQVAADVIDALPGESREILLLYYREGQSSRQVAALLGMQDSAVRKRLSRARQSIREELLTRLGKFARQTAPGSAFTATVLGAMTLASPPAAAAVILTTGGSALAKSGAGKFLLGSAGPLGLGIAGALVGVWWGLRQYLRAPFDAAERRSLLRYAAVMTMLVMAFALSFAFTLVDDGTPDAWRTPMIATGLYALVMILVANLWLPAILARRREVENRADPVATAELATLRGQLAYIVAVLSFSRPGARASVILAKRRREVLCNWGNTVLGLSLGFVCLYLGLRASGRL